MMDCLLRQTIVENQQLSSEVSSLLNGVSWDLTSLGYAENSRWTIRLNNSPPPANHQSSSLKVDQMIGPDMVPLSENPNKEYTNVGVRLIPALITRELLLQEYAEGKGLSPNPETMGSIGFKTFWNKHLNPHQNKEVCLIRGEFFESKRPISRRFIQRLSHFEVLMAAMNGEVGTGNLNPEGEWFISGWDYRNSPYEKYLKAAGIHSTDEELQKPPNWNARLDQIIEIFVESQLDISKRNVFSDFFRRFYRPMF